MRKRLLTFDDLIDFYSKYKKSIHFDADKSGAPIVVQSKAVLSFKEDEKNFAESLTPVCLQACHTDVNLNKSAISKEVMEEKFLPTFKNRPILGYIHEVDGELNFYGHNMHIEDDEMVYDEIPVGIVPETNNAEMTYDEDEKHYNVFVDGYIFDEYTKAAEILRREEELACSVEIALSKFSYDAKDKVLVIEDGYFSGVTILGVDEKGNDVKPGMKGSNVKLKDFNMENNSLIHNSSKDSELIEALEHLTKILSSLNINHYGKEEPNLENEKFNENVDTTPDVVENNEQDTPVEDEACKKKKKCGEDSVIEDEACSGKKKKKCDEDTDEAGEDEGDGGEPTDTTDPTEPDETDPDDADTDDIKDDDNSENEPATSDDEQEKKFSFNKETGTLTFELSNEDIRYGLYGLLAEYEDVYNDYFYIVSTYNDRFIYQSYYSGKYYGQKYTVNDNQVSFDGERYELFVEFLTESEKASLDTMRANYSSISEKLSKYEAAELRAEKESVLSDPAYSAFLGNADFQEIESKIDTYSVDDLRTACELAYAKAVRTTKATFSAEQKPAPSVFAFARVERETSFLDGLLKK